MSQETIQWLNENTMIGFTKQRDAYKHMGWGLTWDADAEESRAWWYEPGFQNGYPGAIPVEEVERVLFNWTPIETEIMHKRRDGVDESNCDAIDGNGPFLWVPSERFKGIMHPETEYEFGVFGIDTYRIHTYKEWLVDNLATLVDGEVGIGTAGLLRQGGVAYVSVELPEGIKVAGYEFRPMLMACTSLDGTKATTYKMVDQVPVCDNTLELALQGEDNQFKVRHSSRSLGRLSDARDALGIIYQHSEDMERFLSSLVDVDVTDAQFNSIVQAIKPIPSIETGFKGGKVVVTNQRAITIAENVQNELRQLWHNDPRVKPWSGTLLGAFQATNTWHNHYRSNSDNGVERVMTSTLANNTAKFDREFFEIVQGLGEIALPEHLAALV